MLAADLRAVELVCDAAKERFEEEDACEPRKSAHDNIIAIEGQTTTSGGREGAIGS